VAIGVLALAGATVLLTNNLGDIVAASAAAANTNKASAMKIKLTSVMVDDQDKAFRFYTEVLEFAPKRDLPAGQERWLTVVSRAEPNGTELLLEPMGFAPARIYQKALFEAGIPMGAFAVENLQAAYERMKGRGAVFSTAPTNIGPTTIAVLEDTCGNRLQLFEVARASNSSTPAAPMIKLTSVMVDDQDKALAFYSKVLGFVKKRDVPAGNGRWLTVVSPDEPDGTELLLEPISFAPARTFQQALFAAGIPFTAFAVGDVQKEYERMKKAGVAFRMEPTKMGPTTVAIFEDTCGNFIQLFQE
jgi:predicted enzyme related to lactoylglutathione lyase